MQLSKQGRVEAFFFYFQIPRSAFRPQWTTGRAQVPALYPYNPQHAQARFWGIFVNVMKLLAIKVLIGAAIIAVFCFPTAVGAQTADTAEGKNLAPLFSSLEPLAVTIEAPLTTLMTERSDEEYLDGTFSYTEDDGTVRTLDLKIRSRGNYRRQEKTCDFTPIRLNFRKKQVEDTVFADQDKLKLVTHCQNSISYFNQHVLREYLAYRILQLMTDKSFAVRLFEVTYVDTEGSINLTKLAFAIEDDDSVAERVGMQHIESGNIEHDDLDRQQENLVNIFQYLIGNTDFSLVHVEPGKSCCHNSRLLSATGAAPFTPIPYDFDFSGLVNTPYASPNPKFKLRNVRQRLYRGVCKNNDLVPGTIQQFLDKKEAIYGLLDEIDLLSNRSRRDVTAYLKPFFDTISNPKLVQSRIIGRCGGPE